MGAQAERITIESAVLIVGVPLRNLYSLAAAGSIPGAAKIGKRWTFDETRLRSWLREREAETCRSARRRKIAIGVAKPSGVALRSQVKTSDGAYELAMQRLRSGASPRNARS